MENQTKNFSEHVQPHNLEKYSFLWSELRLIFAAVSLLLGGVPVLTQVLSAPGAYGLAGNLLNLCWIISGAASGYLLYRFIKSGKTVFGGKTRNDLIAFFVSVVSGINLGLTGLTGNNIGMSIAYGKVIFAITGIIYLATAYYLYTRWQTFGKKLF